jgi:GT2 family glycosyltransferase
MAHRPALCGPGKAGDHMNAQVSIIVPAFNAGRFLDATLHSIRAQALRDFDCVVVDDGSTDDTPLIARHHAREDARFRVIQQRNAGHGAAKNAGFAESDPRTPYVIFMDADDLWRPEALQVLVATLEKNPKSVAAHAIADHIDEFGNPLNPGKAAGYERDRIGLEGLRPVRLQAREPTTFSVLAYEDRVFPSGVIMYRRQALQATGVFDTSLPQHEDTHLHLRLATRGDFAFVDQILVLYRQHPSNWSKRNKEAARAYWIMRQALARSPLLSDEHRRILRRTSVLFQRRKAAMWVSAGRHDLAKGDVKKAANCLAHALVNGLRCVKLQMFGIDPG